MSALDNTFEEINSVISGVDEFFEFNPDWINMRDTFFLDLTGQNIGVANIEPTEALDISGNMKVDGYINQVVSGAGTPFTLHFPNNKDGGFYYDTDNDNVYLCYNHTGELFYSKFNNESFDRLQNTFSEIDSAISGVDSLTPTFPEIDAVLVGVNNWTNPIATVDAEISGLTGLFASYQEIDYAATGISSLTVSFSEIDAGINKIESITPSANDINLAVNGYNSLTPTESEIDQAVTGYNSLSSTEEQIDRIITGADSFVEFNGSDNFLTVSGDFNVSGVASLNYTNQKVEGASQPTTGDFPLDGDQGIYKNTLTEEVFDCFNDEGTLVLKNIRTSTSEINIKEEFFGENDWTFINNSGVGFSTGILDSNRFGVLKIQAGSNSGDCSSLFYGDTGNEGSFDQGAISNSDFLRAEYLFRLGEISSEAWIGISESPTGSSPNESSFIGARLKENDSDFNFVSSGDLGSNISGSSVTADINYHTLVIEKADSDWVLSIDNVNKVTMPNNFNPSNGLTFSIQTKTSVDLSDAKVHIDAFAFSAIR
jgi:hypothetical protein